MWLSLNIVLSRKGLSAVSSNYLQNVIRYCAVHWITTFMLLFFSLFSVSMTVRCFTATTASRQLSLVLIQNDVIHDYEFCFVFRRFRMLMSPLRLAVLTGFSEFLYVLHNKNICCHWFPNWPVIHTASHESFIFMVRSTTLQQYRVSVHLIPQMGGVCAHAVRRILCD